MSETPQDRPNRKRGREMALEGLLRARLGESDPGVARRVIASLQSDAEAPARTSRSPFRRTIISLAVAASLLVTVGVTGWLLLGGGKPVVGVVARATGDVRVRATEGAEPRAVKAGEAVRAGATFSTGPDGAMAWSYSGDATTVALAENTQCALARQGKTLHLRAGELTASVAEQKKGSRFVVTTPQARVEVKGTKLVVRANSATTTVDVTEGVVGLASADGRSAVEVLAGERGEVVAGLPATKYSLAIGQRSASAPTEADPLFADDFEGDLSRWQIGLMKGLEQDRVALDASLFPPAEWVNIQEMPVRGMKSRALTVTAPKDGSAIPFASPRLPKEMDEYDAEMDVCLARGGVDTRLMFLATPPKIPIQIISNDESASTFTPGRWHRQRIEIRRLASEGGKPPTRDIRRFVDGRLADHRRYQGATPAIGVVVMKGDVSIDNVVVRPAGDRTREGRVWSWAAEYYKAHGEWFLQRERFKDGDLFGTVAPSEISASHAAGPGRMKRDRQILKSGATGDCLRVENTDMKYHVVGLIAPASLPRAFAVEIDIKPLDILPPPGQKSVPLPFKFDAHDKDGSSRESLLLYPEDLPSTQVQRVQNDYRSAIALGQWFTYRAEYFRVGMNPDGTTAIYELSLPHGDGREITLGSKKDRLFTVAFRGCRVLVGEARFRRLVVPVGAGPGGMVPDP